MKKIVSSLVILTISLTLFAQNADLEQLYYSYKGEEGVVAIRVPGFLLRIASSIADLDKEEKQLLRSMKSVKVLTIEEPSLYHGVNFVDEINLDRLNNGYQLLMQVRDGWNGFLVEMGNEEELAEKIRYLLDNPDKANQMGANAKEFARQFDWSNITQRYLEVYISLDELA